MLFIAQMLTSAPSAAALTVQLVINPGAGSEPTSVKGTEVAEDITQGGPDST
jgi:hypothetical protein